MKKASQSIATGALFLTLSGLLVKIIGMIYKIPLTNWLGEDGMGYFNTAYTVYTLFFVLSGSGLPIALSLLVSRDLATGRSDVAEARFSVMRRFSSLLGFFLFLLLLFLAKPLSAFFHAEKSYLAILSVAPALWFVTASGAYRGYYQGRGNMLPTAITQLIEALGKLFFGLLFIALSLRIGALKEQTAAFAIFGLSLASLFAYLVLLFLGRKRKKASLTEKPMAEALLRDTLKSALPVTASSLAASLAASLDLVFLMRALQSIGYTPDAANAAWGNYSALVLPLFHMPQVLLLPIASSSLVALRAYVAKGEKEKAEKLLKSAMLVTVILSLVSSLGLSLFSRDILSLIFRDEAAVLHAYPQLSLVAMAVFPFGLLTLSASFLQAYGRLWLPTVSLFLGALLKALVTVFGVSLFGEAVSAFGTLLSYTLSAALNMACLSRVSGCDVTRSLLGKPFALATLSIALALMLKLSLAHFGLSGHSSTLAAVIGAGCAAGLLTLLFGALKKDDLAALGIMTKKIT